MADAVKDFKKGHRKRVIDRLEQGAFVYKYEVVEMMLFLIFKRKDTKTLAKTLLERFGSINGMLMAEKEEMLKIDGIGEASYNSLQIIRTIIREASKERFVNKDILDCFDDVIRYCQTNMTNLKNEEFRIIFMNGAKYVIRDEIVHRGTIDSVSICCREIAHKCIQYGAKNIILVHNHPSLDPTPSADDIQITREIEIACLLFNVKVIDHIIIGGEKYVSFKNLLLLPK
ncbi:MAG: DNA repair protein RadC [Holosporales bacterium]|jgi:DNA repair protein RadC|nr:DNA repair protein RadC [Holosporales bacterium]